MNEETSNAILDSLKTCTARDVETNHAAATRTERVIDMNGGSNGGWNEESEKICCGSYPVRFPFRTMNGERACCGEKTFNTQLLSCCEDGSVRPRC